MSLEGREPILELWPYMSIKLKRMLLGALQQHKIVSTRKAIASFRAVPEIKRLLDEQIHDQTDVPPHDQDSELASEASARGPPPRTFTTSPCVSNTAASFLDEIHQSEGSREIDEMQFFLRLIDVSCGPMMEKWREDGFNGKVVGTLISGESLRNRSEEDTDTCKICFEKTIDSVILECGHSAICMECSKGLRTCPICRQPILRIVKVFKA